MTRNYLHLIDHACPIVREMFESLENDPMSEGAPLGDIMRGFAKRHLKVCGRCKAHARGDSTPSTPARTSKPMSHVPGQTPAFYVRTIHTKGDQGYVRLIAEIRGIQFELRNTHKHLRFPRAEGTSKPEAMVRAVSFVGRCVAKQALIGGRKHWRCNDYPSDPSNGWDRVEPY